MECGMAASKRKRSVLSDDELDSTNHRGLPGRLLRDPSSATEHEVRILAGMALSRGAGLDALIAARQGDSVVVVLVGQEDTPFMLTSPSCPEELLTQRVAQYVVWLATEWRRHVDGDKRDAE